MNKTKFDEFIRKKKNENSKIFGLKSDCKPTYEDISELEQYYNIVLPSSYKEFLLQYGGGYFAYIVVYSLDNQSCFYIKNNVTIKFVNDNNFFPVIDFETGDLAGFKIDNGRVCEDIIALYNHDEKVFCSTELNFYETLKKYSI